MLRLLLIAQTSGWQRSSHLTLRNKTIPFIQAGVVAALYSYTLYPNAQITSKQTIIDTSWDVSHVFKLHISSTAVVLVSHNNAAHVNRAIRLPGLEPYRKLSWTQWLLNDCCVCKYNQRPEDEKAITMDLENPVFCSSHSSQHKKSTCVTSQEYSCQSDQLPHRSLVSEQNLLLPVF